MWYSNCSTPPGDSDRPEEGKGGAGAGAEAEAEAEDAKWDGEQCNGVIAHSAAASVSTGRSSAAS